MVTSLVFRSPFPSIISTHRLRYKSTAYSYHIVLAVQVFLDYWGKVDTDAVGVLAQDKSTRIWLDLMLRRSLKKCVDWSRIDKNAYLEAMRHSVVDPAPIKALLQGALTDKIDDRETFMKGIDYSYYYEQTE